MLNETIDEITKKENYLKDKYIDLTKDLNNLKNVYNSYILVGLNRLNNEKKDIIYSANLSTLFTKKKYTALMKELNDTLAYISSHKKFLEANQSISLKQLESFIKSLKLTYKDKLTDLRKNLTNLQNTFKKFTAKLQNNNNQKNHLLSSINRVKVEENLKNRNKENLNKISEKLSENNQLLNQEEKTYNKKIKAYSFHSNIAQIDTTHKNIKAYLNTLLQQINNNNNENEL